MQDLRDRLRAPLAPLVEDDASELHKAADNLDFVIKEYCLDAITERLADSPLAEQAITGFFLPAKDSGFSRFGKGRRFANSVLAFKEVRRGNYFVDAVKAGRKDSPMSGNLFDVYTALATIQWEVEAYQQATRVANRFTGSARKTALGVLAEHADDAVGYDNQVKVFMAP